MSPFKFMKERRLNEFAHVSQEEVLDIIFWAYGEVWLKPVISPKSDWLKIIGLFSAAECQFRYSHKLKELNK